MGFECHMLELVDTLCSGGLPPPRRTPSARHGTSLLGGIGSRAEDPVHETGEAVSFAMLIFFPPA